MSVTKVALVTGAAQGIGAAIALQLAKDGFNVALVDLPYQEKKALEAIAAIKAAVPSAKAVFIAADTSKRDQVFEAVEKTYKELGSFDVIVNNAGICITKSLLETTEEDMLRLQSINVNGVLWGIQAAAQKFIELKHPGGKIINACSIAGHLGFPTLGGYSSTKFGIKAFTQTAAKELAPHKITVNAYCPGPVNTPMFELIDSRLAEINNVPKGAPTQQFVDTIALAREEEPEDVAGLVSFFASDKSNYITGQSYIVDGGMVFA